MLYFSDYKILIVRKKSPLFKLTTRVSHFIKSRNFILRSDLPVLATVLPVVRGRRALNVLYLSPKDLHERGVGKRPR